MEKNCQIKTEGYFEKWEKAFISIEPHHIIFTKKKEKLKFPIKALQLKLKDSARKVEIGYKGKKKATIQFSSKVGSHTYMDKFISTVQEYESR